LVAPRNRSYEVRNRRTAQQSNCATAKAAAGDARTKHSLNRRRQLHETINLLTGNLVVVSEGFMALDLKVRVKGKRWTAIITICTIIPWPLPEPSVDRRRPECFGVRLWQRLEFWIFLLPHAWRDSRRLFQANLS